MSFRRDSGRSLLGGLVLLGLFSGVAEAQPGRPPSVIPPQLSPASAQDGDVGRHFGIHVTERLLASGDSEERLRGIRRLAAEDTPRALDLLIRTQEPGSIFSRDMRARLEAVRVLGPHLAQDGPRQVVVRALVDGATLASGNDGAELAGLLRDTAAMVLGRHGGARGTDALAGLLRQGGSVASATSRSLVVHPPERIDALVGARAPGSVELIDLLVSLGDLRAIPYLRRVVRSGEPAVRAASLVALATLGDGEAPLIARQWVKEAELLPKSAAIRALLRTSPGEGRSALASLLREPSSREEALRLSLEGPGPELAEGLSALVQDASLSSEQRSLATEALGRSGGELAAKTLGALLSSPQGHEAALALALSPGKPARKALERALTGDSRVTALRASVIRALALHDAPSGLFDAADEVWKGSTHREAAVFAWVALGKRSPVDKDFSAPPLLGAAARGALVAGPEVLYKILEKLEQEPGAERARRDTLALGLLARTDGGKLSSRMLLDWVDEGGIAAPLAARALAARDDEATLGRVERLLQSGSPQLRAHAALGLGRSPRPDAAGRLVNAYAYETEAGVRRAIVRALSWRIEPQRAAVLKLAAELDPDATVRTVAKAALRGQKALEQASGEMVSWLRVEGGQGAVALRWERPDGLVLPVVTDEDGSLLVPGLPSAPSHVVVPLAQTGCLSPRPPPHLRG